MLCVGLFVVCLFDLWQVDKHYLNDASFTDPVQMQTLTPSAAEDVVRKDKTDFRVLNLSEGNPFNETSNRTAYFFQSIGGYNAAKLHRYQDLIDRCLNDELQGFLGAINMAGGDMQRVPGDSLAPVLNMLNTKWIIFGAQAGQALQNPYANGNLGRDRREIRRHARCRDSCPQAYGYEAHGSGRQALPHRARRLAFRRRQRSSDAAQAK